jgi:hypothetical protein
LTLLGVIGSDNKQDVEAALSIQTRVLIDLPVFRNFFAHRNRGTREATQHVSPRYGIRPRPRPDEMLRSRALGRPQPLIQDWLDDLSTMCELLCL